MIEQSKAISRKISQFVKKHDGLIDQTKISKLNGKLAPCFKLTPDDLDPKRDLMYPCDRYAFFGITYCRL